MSSHDDAARSLLPGRIVALATSVDCKAFAEAIDVPLLLVRIDAADAELRTALEDVFETGAARVDAAMGFRTATEDSSVARPGSMRPGPPSFGAPQMRVRLIRAMHFAVPLRKRQGAGKSFTERISIGRARNNDVVLRHESVSKFHAWIARDEEDAYYVADASSRNGTTLNSARLAPAITAAIATGDVLRFGAIEAVLCSAAVLWGALRE